MPLIKATTQNFTKSVLGDIQGDKIATIGVGTSDAIRPKSGTLRVDGLSLQNDPTIFKAIGGQSTNTLDGTITLDPLGGAGTNVHNFTSGDRILFTLDSTNADYQNFLVGLVYGRHYFAIPVDSTSFKLARTQADATASPPVPITFGSTRAGTTTIVPIFQFENLSKIKINNPSFGKIQNSLFDYGTQNPNQLTLNATPFLSSANEDIDYTANNDIGSVPYWRRFSGLLTNGTFLPHAGTEWFTNEAPYRRVEDNARQSKVLSLYGSSTLLPNNIGYAQTGGYNGFYNINELAGNSASHTKDGIFPNANHNLAGNSNYWVKHEWYQQLRDVAKVVRANGKIKFGVKVRQPIDDLMRLNDFAGMYVKVEYPKSITTSGVAIGYFKIQRRDSTGITLPTGEIDSLSERLLNWHGAEISPFNVGDDQRANSPYTLSTMTIQELDTIYAEDIRDFEQVEVEMDIPSDFMTLVHNDYSRQGEMHNIGSSVGKDYTDSIAVSVGLYYSDNCGNLMGMEGADGTSEDNTYSSVSVGERVFVNNSGTDTTALKAFGYEHNGSVFTDFNSTTVPRGALLRKKSGFALSAATRDVVNDTQIRSNELVVGDPYFIDSLDGITQAEMHNLAGTVPGEEIDVKYMVPGQTYTISDLGTGGSWSAISEQNEGFSSFGIGADSAEVGYAFKFESFSIYNLLPSGGKVTRGGYPKFTLFTPRKTTTDQKGYFTRTSGSVQFYSPFLEILPPDDLPESAFVPYIGDTFGGTTIAENNQYAFPSGSQSWGGFTQSNHLVYPYRFYADNNGNGGKISFTGAVDGGGSTTISFKFNYLPYNRLGDTSNSTDTTETYSVVISGDTEQTYTVDIPQRTQRVPIAVNTAVGFTTEAEKTNEFNELTMYISDIGTTITFKDLVVTDYT